MKNRFVAWLFGDRVPMALSVVVLMIVWLAVTGRVAVLEDLQKRIEALAFDARMRMTLPGHEIDPMVVIVDIDEKSLAAEGQWPWPRRKLATLVEKLDAASVQAIAFDATFPEPDRNAASELLEGAGDRLDPAIRGAIEAERENVDQDRMLAEAFAASASPVILGYTFTPPEFEGKGALSASPVQYAGDLDATTFITMSSYAGNLPILQDAAKSAGFFTILEDFDGVVRRVPAVIRHGDTLYPSLELEVMRRVLGVDRIHVITQPYGDRMAVNQILIGDPDDPMHQKIPTDGLGRLIVPYLGPSPQFYYLSATDVLHDRIGADQLQGSVVLIGQTALGLKDLRSTPVQQSFPGVEIHANAIFALFNNIGFPVPPVGEDVNMLVILALGLIVIVLFPRLQPASMIVVSIVLLGALIGANVWLWTVKKLALALATPVLVLITLTFIYVNFRVLAEARSRRNLRDRFKGYVPDEVVEEMYRDPDKDFGLQGERREMTVLFSDIRGFTNLSEGMEPQVLTQFLNAWFTPVTELIFGHRGTFDKYVGDMVMAYWGAPTRNPEHRQHAVETALDMVATLPRVQQEFAARGWPPIDVGIGISTGEMNFGNMGSERKHNFTVLGDAVNLGSRLEGLTKNYGVRLIVSEATAELTSGILYRQLDRVRVKGKAEPVNIHEAVCREAEANDALREELRAHHVALQKYFAADWDAAVREFGALAATHPQRRCYKLYLERIADLRKSVATGAWDGVYEYTSK
jgi:adenylate cyclase